MPEGTSSAKAGRADTEAFRLRAFVDGLAGTDELEICDRPLALADLSPILDGNSRGFRYPRWQFDIPPARLATVLRKLDALDASCWAKHHFLTRPSPCLDGRTPRELLVNRDAGLAAVCSAIDEHFTGEQGAA